MISGGVVGAGLGTFLGPGIRSSMMGMRGGDLPEDLTCKFLFELGWGRKCLWLWKCIIDTVILIFRRCPHQMNNC